MKLKLFVFLFTICCALNAQHKISGQILDEDDQPLPYVNIYLKNTTNGTSSSFDGRFQLDVSKKRGRIEISFVGYETQSLKYSPNKTYFKIILKEASNTLDEVIIVSKPKKRLKKGSLNKDGTARSFTNVFVKMLTTAGEVCLTTGEKLKLICALLEGTVCACTVRIPGPIFTIRSDRNTNITARNFGRLERIGILILTSNSSHFVHPKT